jgi:hypothetical protein
MAVAVLWRTPEDGLTPSHRSGVVESLTARFAWQEDDHYGHEKKEVA